jgi:hypothetical protein
MAYIGWASVRNLGQASLAASAKRLMTCAISEVTAKIPHFGLFAFQYVTGDGKAHAKYELWAKTYPRDRAHQHRLHLQQPRTIGRRSRGEQSQRIEPSLTGTVTLPACQT